MIDISYTLMTNAMINKGHRFRTEYSSIQLAKLTKSKLKNLKFNGVKYGQE
jgi:hypothetical protein